MLKEPGGQSKQESYVANMHIRGTALTFFGPIREGELLGSFKITHDLKTGPQELGISLKLPGWGGGRVVESSYNLKSGEARTVIPDELIEHAGDIDQMRVKALTDLAGKIHCHGQGADTPVAAFGNKSQNQLVKELAQLAQNSANPPTGGQLPPVSPLK